MNTTAHADQLHAEVRDARDCDALDPCTSCRAKTAEVRAIRHAARVAAVAIPRPRTALAARLARVSA